MPQTLFVSLQDPATLMQVSYPLPRGTPIHDSTPSDRDHTLGVRVTLVSRRLEIWFFTSHVPMNLASYQFFCLQPHSQTVRPCLGFSIIPGDPLLYSFVALLTTRRGRQTVTRLRCIHLRLWSAGQDRTGQATQARPEGSHDRHGILQIP